MKTILAIVGPTAIGKTKLATELQQSLRGSFGLSRPQDNRNSSGDVALISIDSRQIYVGMDIGTGKDAKIFGNDLVEPNKLFNVSDFASLVKPEIKKLWEKNILPILVGGTGLYLKALLNEIDTIDIPPDLKLRKRFEKSNVKEMQEYIVSTYPYIIQNQKSNIKNQNFENNNKSLLGPTCGMNNSDWNNSRRLIRKIEVLQFYEKFEIQNSKLETNSKFKIKNSKLQIDNILIIGLTAPLTQLKKNIELRVQSRLDKGLLKEIKGLAKKYGWNEVLRNTIAYKEWENYFNNKEKYEEVIAKWTKDEINYAKRQMTWFKKDTRVVWLQENYLEESLKIIEERKLLFQNLCNS